MFDLYYRNPRLLVLTLLLIVVAGVSAWLQLPRREDPELTSRTALVFTRFPGADAERVESLVTEKIEDELREVEEIRQIKSQSRAGISILRIDLKDEVVQTDDVWSRVRDRLDDAKVQFPDGVLDPQFEEFTIDAYTLIAAVAWERDTAPNHAILRRLSEELEDELRSVPGTKETDLFGENPEEIVVEIDAEELAARGITAASVAEAIRRSDSKVAAGQLRSGSHDLLIEVEGELDSLDRIERIPIRYGKGDEVVRLGDIATLRKTITEPARSIALVNGRVAIAVAARMESGRRVDVWSAAARKKLDAFRQRLPRGVGLEVVFQQSRYTEVRMSELLKNLGIGALLVLGVILFMMGWRSALLVGAALPLASLMVLSGMHLLGVPLHQMSITGLIIALGLLIDSAIVMVDEVRHQRQQQSARAAVASAVRRMAVPLGASTLTTALAFMPLLMGAGPVGEFVGPMSISVMLAIFSALFLALTVTPTLAGFLDRAYSGKSRWWRTGFSHPGLLAAYRATLGAIFSRPVLALVLAIALPLVGFWKGLELEQQFFPPTGRDQFPIELRMPAQSSIELTRTYALRARELMLRHPQVESVQWFVGGSAPKFYYNMVEGEDGTASYAQALVQLRSADDAPAVMNTLQARLDGAFPAAQFIVKQIEQGPPFDAPIELHLLGPDLDRLRHLGERLRKELAQVEGVTHTRATLAHGRPKLWVKLDEESANLAGFDRVGIARQLDAYLEGVVGGSLLEATEELPIRVRVRRGSRGDIDTIANLDLVAGPGRWTPLSVLGRLGLRPALSNLPHLNGLRVNSIQGFLEAGTLPDKALRRFMTRARTILDGLPQGYRFELGGEISERERAQSQLFGSAGVLLILMMATLVLGLNSFRYAGVIGFVALLCVGLAMGALWLFGYPFGFMAIVGTMGLVGVAINDAIVVLASLRDDPRAREGDPAAVAEVVVRSTRHILSTTVTTAAGFLPLMLAGGGFWPPLAVVIVGGVAGATLLALYFVPAAHLMLARRARRKLPAATLTSTNRRENRPSEVDLVAAEHLQGVFLKGLTAQGSLGEASVLKETK